MLHVRFSRDNNDKFIISDYNDEQLYVIAQALIHDAGRTELKKILKNVENIESDTYQPIKYDKSITISILQLDKITVMLKYEDTQDFNEQTKKLNVEIAIDTLEELIQVWQDLITEDSEHIFLTRHEDVYTLTNSSTNI